jgi:hypothetical protein
MSANFGNSVMTGKAHELLMETRNLILATNNKEPIFFLFLSNENFQFQVSYCVKEYF